MTTFALPTCTLRPWRAEDAASIARHADNRNVSRNLRDVFPSPYTLADAQAWLAAQVGRAPLTDFAIEVDGEAVGSIGLRVRGDVYRRTAEIGYWLAETHWGRGIMSDAVGAVTRYGIDTLALVRIDAHVFAPNVASARVLERNGYVLEGRLRHAVEKDGEVLDALVYAFVAEG